jgi:hypothetical protein
MATPVIDLIALMTKAIKFARMDTEMSEDDIIHLVLSKVTLGVSVASEVVPSVPVRKAVGTSRGSKGDASEKEKRARAPPKDDIRCMARTLDESEHSVDGRVGGVLKVMRSDPLNLYGDRCKRKKTGDCDFCGQHQENQPLGIWDGEYSMRFRLAVEKTESESEKKASRGRSVPPALKKKVPVVEPVVEEDEEEESAPVAKIVRKPAVVEKKAVPAKKASIFDEDETPAPVPKKGGSEKKAAPKTLSVEDLEMGLDSQETKPLGENDEDSKEEESVDVVDIEIEGERYSIDKDGNVYVDSGETVGVYDEKKKKWTVKYG